MKAKKYGAVASLRSFFKTVVTRKNLFTNTRRCRVLSSVREYVNGQMSAQWFEVHEFVVDLTEMSIKKERIIATRVYADAWDLVKDPEHEMKGKAK